MGILRPGAIRAFSLLLIFCSGIAPAGGAELKIDASPQDSALIRDIINKDLLRLESILKIYYPDTINIIIAYDRRSFDMAAGAILPDWGAAVAIKEKKLIIIKSPNFFDIGKNLEELLAHELGHLVLERASGGRWLPRWFEEGFCQLISGEWRFEQDILLMRAVWGSGLIPLAALEDVNRFGGAKAALAYAESYLAVSSLGRDLGMDFFADFLPLYRESGNFYQSFFNSSGYKFAEWVSLWQEKTHQRYRFVLFIFDSRLLFPLLAIAIILLYFIKRWQTRKKRKQWERQEKLFGNDQGFPT